MSLEQLDSDLKKLWEIDDFPKTPILRVDDAKCKEHFVKTHTRDATGRYVVRLPFRSNPPTSFKNSRSAAVAQLHRLEVRLRLDNSSAEEYASFMQEYEELGHMSAI